MSFAALGALATDQPTHPTVLDDRENGALDLMHSLSHSLSLPSRRQDKTSPAVTINAVTLDTFGVRFPINLAESVVGIGMRRNESLRH